MPVGAGVRPSTVRSGIAGSEARFRSTFEQVAVGIAHTTTAGRILEVNRKLCEMLGYSHDELLSITTRDLTHPEDRDRQDDMRHELLAGTRSHFSGDKRYLRKDGSVFWVNRTVTLARETPDGEPYLIQTIDSINKRKLAEANLMRLARARHVMAECSHVLVHTTDETRMLEDMCRIVVESGGYKMAWVGLATGDEMRPVFPVAHAGFGDDAPMTESVAWNADGRYQGFMHAVITVGEPHIARDILNDPRNVRRRERATKHGFQSSIALPLTNASEGRILGAIAMYAREPDAFDADEIALLTEMADDIAFGITNLRTRVAREQAEQRSRENERRFSAIFDQAAVGITRVDLNGTLVDVNQKFCDMLGYTRDELLGKTVKDVTHPDDYGSGAQYRAQLTHDTAKPMVGEKRFVRKNGTSIWTRRTMSTALDDAGNPLYLISVIEDITERKGAEDTLRATFDQANIGIAITSPELRFLQVNDKFCQILGYNHDEIMKIEVQDMQLPGGFEATLEVCRKLVAGEITGALREKQLKRKDGVPVWTSLSTSLVREPDGAPRYFVTLVQDITERKALELQFRDTFEQAAVGIFHADLNGRYLRVNRKFCEITGYTEEEMTGPSRPNLSHPEDFDSGNVERKKLLSEEIASHSNEKRYVRRDGRVIWVNRTESLARAASGKPLYFIRVIEDITERKLSALRREMEHTVTAMLAEAPSLEAVMPRIIRTMCEAMGWAYGARWVWDEKEQRLCRAEYWCEFEPEFDPADREHWLKVANTGSGRLLRRAWIDKKATWLSNLHDDKPFRRRASVVKLGWHSAYAFPIQIGNDVIGVMEFFGEDKREPDEALLQVTGSIGSQIGQFVQRKEAEQALRASEERYRDLFELSPLPMWVWDDETRAILAVNDAAVNHYGYSQDEFLRMNVRDIWALGDQTQYEESLRDRSHEQTLHLQRQHRTKDGRIVDVEITAQPFMQVGRPVWLTLVNDITGRKQAEERLMHLAHYDVLTNLPNRVLFYDRLKQALAQAKRNQWITGVMFMDVDRFKNINDTLGHAVGDLLLQQVSERLVRSVRSGDTVGRLGGDEFAIVLSNLSSAQDASLVAQKIMANFNEPFKLEGAEVFVTASIGITLYPEDSTEQDALIKNADAAMYKAKEAGRNSYQFYTPEMNARGFALLKLEGSLRHALERDEFLLHYQPKASVADGKITGFEALLRWNHPERGLVSPAEFIPVLEETGLIVPAGAWVLNAVCLQIKQWEHAGVKQMPVAVNLSARQFLTRDLGPTIKGILDEHRVDPRLLELEITESSLMVNPEEAARTLVYLKSLGVSLSIDDFGTGYSSLGYLKRFPLDALKVDGSFVRDITTNPDDATITRAVISMAHSLGLKVIAEGVETEPQLAFLAEYGCNEIQGYYFARPMPAEECAAWLTQGHSLKRQAQTVLGVIPHIAGK